MKYKVDYTKQALKQIKKFDNYTKAMILHWIDKNLNKTENPFQHGKELKGNYKGKWKYKVGDYRIISVIKDDELLILVVEVGHRREIYKK